MVVGGVEVSLVQLYYIMITVMVVGGMILSSVQLYYRKEIGWYHDRGFGDWYHDTIFGPAITDRFLYYMDDDTNQSWRLLYNKKDKPLS